MQFLDRVPFTIDQCEAQPDGGARIRCQIPVHSWYAGRTNDVPIPPAERPHLTRTFLWSSPGSLQITDEPTSNPEGKVRWHLHVVATSAGQTGAREVTFILPNDAGRLVVKLPSVPKSLSITRGGLTTHLACEYPEATLSHELMHLPTDQ